MALNLKPEMLTFLESLKSRENRDSWRYRPVSKRQIKFLHKREVPQDYIDKIDRGGASCLISYILKVEN